MDRLVAGYARGVPILRGVDFVARDGAISAIIGPNGAGKSTFLKAVAGLVPFVSGSVRLNGDSILGAPPRRLVDGGMCFVPQERTVFPEMSVRENLVMGAWPRRREKAWIAQRLEQLASDFPLLINRADDSAGALSGGQQKMLELARGLMTQPSLLLLDEPTAGLSPKLATEVYQKLDELNAKSSVTVVIVDQNVREALEIADHVYVLAMGKNDTDGTAADIGSRLDSIVKGWMSTGGSGLADV